MPYEHLLDNISSLVEMNSPLKSIWNNVVRIDFESGNESGSGSGMLIDDDFVLTCDHVVNPNGMSADKIYVNKDRKILLYSRRTK